MAQMEDDFQHGYRTWHTRLSYAKSTVRIIGCALALLWPDAITVLAISLLLAELVGIAEEWI
jgi:hypothetical protein